MTPHEVTAAVLLIFTKISSRAIVGVGTWLNTNCPPYSSNLTAFMRVLLEPAQWAPSARAPQNSEHSVPCWRQGRLGRTMGRRCSGRRPPATRTAQTLVRLHPPNSIPSVFNQRAADWAFSGTGKFPLAHAENSVGCRPAILLASAIWSRESEPKYVCVWK